MYRSREELRKVIQDAQKRLHFIGKPKDSPETIRQKIQHIEQEMSSLLVFAAQSEKTEQFEERFKAMTREKAELSEKLKELEASQSPYEEIGQTVATEDVLLWEFDESFIRRIVVQVTVLSSGQIEVRFVGGVSKVGEISE